MFDPGEAREEAAGQRARGDPGARHDGHRGHRRHRGRGGPADCAGGRTSHAAVVARQLDKVCLVGCTTLRIDEKARTITFGGNTLREGEIICLDAESGRVLDGEPEVVVERPEGLLSEVAKWRAGQPA